MLGWLWRVLIGRFGCSHEWEVLDSVTVLGPHPTELESTICVGTKYHLQCMNCGTVKAKTL
jgi:hypothetical protein